MKKALAIVAILGASPAFAASSPYYVGENITPQNHVNLNFQDTPIKENGAAAGTNLIAVDLRGAWNVNENASVRGSLPFFFATKDLTGTAKNTLGNINLGGGYAWNFQSDNRAWTYGPTVTGDIYAPSSRKQQGNFVGAANPTTDLYKYATGATTAALTSGFFAKGDMFSAKANLGYGLMYISSPNSSKIATAARSSDKARNTITGQLGASYHVLPNLHLNAEYNSIWLDKKTKTIAARGTVYKAFRHALTPSVSGNWEQILGSVFATVPLDQTTRKTTSVAFGINAGYMF